MTSRHPRTVRLVRLIHRAGLALVPRHVRRAYATEMVATFAALSGAAAEQGRLALWRLLVHELADLARSRRANTVPDPIAPPSPVSRRVPFEWLAISRWRQAWRSLRRRPAYLLAAVITFGCGAGITTAVFALVDAVLLKPLPYPDAAALVTVYESSPVTKERTSLVAPGRLDDWQRRTRMFTAIAGNYAENVTDTSGSEPERLDARRVTPRFFDVFGVAPAIGRTFVPLEEQAGGPGGAVISDRFWLRRFGRDSAAIGRTLTIGGRPYTIVGVMPPLFTSATIDLWLPAQIAPGLMAVREARFLGGVARLRPGVSVDAGRDDLMAVQRQLAEAFPASDRGWSVEIQPLKDARIGTAGRGLALVFGAVGALWLIAIANIAGLTLVHVGRRAHEMALRSALGASRPRVIAGLLREGMLIAAVGGALATMVAAWLVSWMPVLLSRTPRIAEVTFDARALMFVLATSAVAACLCSLVPAIAITRARIGALLAHEGRTVASGGHRLQRLLVVGQVALSVMLVGSATLLLRSYYSLSHVDTGFDATRAMTFHVGARWDEDRTRIGQLQRQLLATLAALPHVEGAGMTNFLPASGATLRAQIQIDGLAGPNADGSMTVGSRMVSAGYLSAIRAPLVNGSWCADPAPVANAPLSAMVNRRFVETFAADRPVVGSNLRMLQSLPGIFTITGVVGDVTEDGPSAPAAPYVYVCTPAGSWPDPEYVVRTADPRTFATDLRRVVRELDPARAIFGLRPLQGVVDTALDQPRMDAATIGAFAAAAVILAAIGLYSLFMLIVSARAREMAVRLAIGAAPAQMIGLVVAGAGRLLAVGLVLGVALTLAADRLFRGAIVAVQPVDPLTLATSVGVLAVVAAIAVAGPARRAARITPLSALRE